MASLGVKAAIVARPASARRHSAARPGRAVGQRSIRAAAQSFSSLQIRRSSPASRAGACDAGIAQGVVRREIGRPGLCCELAQVGEHGGRLECEQAERHGLARPHGQLAGAIEGDAAVAAQADGAHVDRLDHRAPAADQGPCVVDRRPAAAHHGAVRGRAAHVGHEKVGQTGQESRADDAGGRPGQHGLHRAFERDLRLHQRSVALDDHERGIDGLGLRARRRAPRSGGGSAASGAR